MSHTFFEFPIRQNLKHAWQLYRNNLWYFVGLAGVMLVINIVFNKYDGALSQVIGILLALFWSYVSLSSALAAVDGKQELLDFGILKQHLPTVRQFGYFAAIGVVSTLIIAGGFIILIIPGIYFATRLMLANIAYVDRREGVSETLRYTWGLVYRDRFWTVLLAFAIAAGLTIIGVMFVVGVLITYPLTLLFIALLYRSLGVAPAHAEVVVQPEELPVATTDTAS